MDLHSGKMYLILHFVISLADEKVQLLTYPQQMENNEYKVEICSTIEHVL